MNLDPARFVSLAYLLASFVKYICGFSLRRPRSGQFLELPSETPVNGKMVTSGGMSYGPYAPILCCTDLTSHLEKKSNVCDLQ